MSLFKDVFLRILLYGFIIIFAIVCLNYYSVVNDMNISKAEKCYKKQNYVCAFSAYRKAFSLGIDNKAYVKHYFETLKKLEKVAVVQYELNNLLELYPDNPVAEEIKEIFQELHNEVLKKYPDTYVHDVVQGLSVVHWNIDSGSLDVFIDVQNASKYPAYYVEEIKKAFSDFSEMLGNKVTFNYINDSSRAQIQIVFMDKISGGQCQEGGECSDVLGLTENNVVGSLLTKSVIKLRLKDADGSDFTKNQIYNIAKHEIGHALGVSGHSYSAEDIMYPVSNDASFAKNARMLLIERKEFSEKDIQTFNLLYEILPDITDKKYDVSKHPNMYLPIVAIGTKQEIGEKNLEESQRYMTAVDTNYISQINLAEGYYANREYNKAEEEFEKALLYAGTSEEKFTVYNNLAVVYFSKKDYKKAIEYSDLANGFSSEELANEIKAYCYIEMRRYKEAQNLLEKMVRKYPDNQVYSAALINVYFRRYKTFSALKELKRIKKENPEAVKEELFDSYRVFLNFV